MKNLITLALLLIGATCAFADDIDYDLLNVRSNVATPAGAPAAAVSAPPAGATGQGAPYYGTGYQTSWYAQPTYAQGDLNYRYQNVKQALSQYAGYYGFMSRERQYYNQLAQQGEDLYVRYLKYRDNYSYAALNQWISQYEYSFGYQGGYSTYNPGYSTGGWNTGYSCSCYTDRYGRTIGSSCQLHYSYYSNGGYSQGNYCSCYYDQWGRQITRNCRNHGYYYPQGSYGYPVYANENYINGLQIGNGIGNIVNGQRYDNGLQTAGGVLSTVGGVLNVINNVRH